MGKTGGWSHLLNAIWTMSLLCSVPSKVFKIASKNAYLQELTPDPLRAQTIYPSAATLVSLQFLQNSRCNSCLRAFAFALFHVWIALSQTCPQGSINSLMCLHRMHPFPTSRTSHPSTHFCSFCSHISSLSNILDKIIFTHLFCSMFISTHYNGSF